MANKMFQRTADCRVPGTVSMLVQGLKSRTDIIERAPNTIGMWPGTATDVAGKNVYSGASNVWYREIRTTRTGP